MFKYQFRLFAIGAAATLAAITQAAAQCCPALVSPCCAPVVQPVVVAPPPMAPCCAPAMYVVNQGPVYSGPGPYVTQRNYIEGDQVAAVGYPYVGYVPGGTEPVYRHPFYRGPRLYRGPGFYRGPAFYRGPGFYRRWAGPRYVGRPYADGFRRPYIGRPMMRATIGPRPARVIYR